jgi:hypothetical protein
MAGEFDKGDYYHALKISILLVLTVRRGTLLQHLILFLIGWFLRPPPPRERDGT